MHRQAKTAPSNCGMECPASVSTLSKTRMMGMKFPQSASPEMEKYIVIINCYLFFIFNVECKINVA